MIEVLQERIFRHRKYYGKLPSKLAVTPEQRVALISEITSMVYMSTPIDDPQEETFMGIPLVVIDII